MKNRKAIVVYLDNTERCIEEFSWLYKTWIINEINKEFDLVVFHNPQAIDHVPAHPNVVRKKMKSYQQKDPFWKDYAFVNSFAMFREPVMQEWILQKYDYILKTDCDVFLTKNILGLEPDITMIGRGGYMSVPEKMPEINLKLEELRKKLKFNSFGYSNVGASIFGKTKSLVPIINLHMVLTKYILETGFKDGNGTWPGWFRGVASMYAIHLAINHILDHKSINLYSLDDWCGANKIQKNTIHIHAWHTNTGFSKLDWFSGKKDILKCEEIEEIPKIAQDYCRWIASNSLTELLEFVKK